MRVPGDRIDERDMRKCLFYVRYLKEKGMASIITANSDPSSISMIVNGHISSRINSASEKVEFINQMKLACERNIVGSEHFKWLIKNERAAYWVWYYFIEPRQINVHLPTFSSNNNSIGMSVPFFIKTPGSILPMCISNSHKLRVDTIMNYFDNWDIGRDLYTEHLSQGFSLSNVLTQVLNNLKGEFSNIVNKKDPFSFLDKSNEDNLLWAWRYIKNHPKVEKVFDLRFLSPVSKNETLLDIYCAWDTSNSNMKYDFLLEFKKAWSQKKFRDKNKDTRVINTRVHKEIKDKLELLAKIHRMNISDIVSMLIEREARNYFK
ncbi:hypothetical protein [Pectobacterium polaris]|uniref:hypothetical protein n=1 Tax=Pectobacterium polaris TaxID=2042057 RepID=UPI0021C6B8D2|nr:hypothetical protein [Pectobacterium polaris]MCU1791397.1 hypothetical protein [Pectobacterium polaris]